MNDKSFSLILKFKDRLYKACAANDTDEVSEILNNIFPIYNKIQDFEDYSKMENFAFINAVVNSFTEACSAGHLATVKIFVESESLEKFKEYNKFQDQPFGYYSNESLIAATRNGHLEVIRYLCDTRLKKHLNFYLGASNLLKHACEEGKLEVVKYLFNDPILSPIIKFNFNRDGLCQSLEKACDNGHLDVVKYLLTSNDLEYKAKVHIDNDAPFKAASYPGLEPVLEYLIFDYGIKITDNISKIIEENMLVRSLFEMREIKKELNQECGSDLIQKRKIKL